MEAVHGQLEIKRQEFTRRMAECHEKREELVAKVKSPYPAKANSRAGHQIRKVPKRKRCQEKQSQCKSRF
jgi:hypothetical protein